MIERIQQGGYLPARGRSLARTFPGRPETKPVAKGDDGRKSGEAKPFPPLIAFEPLQDFQEKILSPLIVARMETSGPEVEAPGHLERKIADRLGKGHRLLAEADRFARITSYIVIVTKINGHLPESPSILERLGEAFGLVEIDDDPLEFAERKQGGLRRSRRRSTACSCRSRVSGSDSSRCSACSKNLTASRLAPRAYASRPALHQ